jgi:hypothetical protein
MIAIPACFMALIMLLSSAATDSQGQEKKEGGKGGPGGKGGFPGGPGGPGGGGFMRGGAPGQIMPEFIAAQLKLTDEQKKSFADLQKEVDSKIEKILNEEQNKQLKDMKERRPGQGGPGGPGGFPGRGGKDGKDGKAKEEKKKIDD